MSNTENSPTNPLIDAVDTLTRARDTLAFVIEAQFRDRNNCPGAGWVLESVETAIETALALLGKVKPLK